MEKKCSKCKIIKDVSFFTKHKNKKLGISSECRECRSKLRTTPEHRKKERERISNNPKLRRKRADYCKKYKKNNKEKVSKFQKNWFLKKLYGISIEEYNDMMVSQEHCCYICGVNQKEIRKSLVVDHDHKSGITRKLLCNNCNTALGLAKEDIVILKKMISYINEYNGGLS